MRKREFSLEPYEAPKINYLLTLVEQGFAGSGNMSEGAGGDGDGEDDNWDQWG